MRRKYALWLLFVILFLASFDMHAQMPLLSPFIKELGAPALLIGLLLSAYSFTNLIGNLTAGPIIDRYSKKGFISVGLMISGILLMLHGIIDSSTQLLGIRLTYGYVMAFVSPACFAVLASSADTIDEQNKIFVQKGIILTFASILSPAVGGFLAGRFGFANSFVILGWVMLITGLIALLFLPKKSGEGKQVTPGGFIFNAEENEQRQTKQNNKNNKKDNLKTALNLLFGSIGMYPAFFSAFAIMYAQGTMMYEVPLLIARQNLDPTVTGMVFSMMGLGSLLTLSLTQIQRKSPVVRCLFGLTILSTMFYATAMNWNVSIYWMMFFVGGAFGLLFPAMTTILTSYSPRHLYGTAFSFYSAIMSFGAILSPVMAGMYDNVSRSFFSGFLVLMTASICCILFQDKKWQAVSPVRR
ncbi:MFS transporter [Brevibacterium sp. JNUCC-42]|nr:MFS transporter [Brevibacterium sp. JNUCC-42]